MRRHNLYASDSQQTNHFFLFSLGKPNLINNNDNKRLFVRKIKCVTSFEKPLLALDSKFRFSVTSWYTKVKFLAVLSDSLRFSPLHSVFDSKETPWKVYETSLFILTIVKNGTNERRVDVPSFSFTYLQLSIKNHFLLLKKRPCHWHVTSYCVLLIFPILSSHSFYLSNYSVGRRVYWPASYYYYSEHENIDC